MSIQTNRTLGGIGACLTLIGAVSGVSSLISYFYPNSGASDLIFSAIGGIFGLFAFVGFILFLISMYGFSKAYGEHRIFSYILWGLIITIVASVMAVVIFVVVLLFNLTSIIPSLNWSTTSSTQITAMMMTYFAPFLAVFGVIALINVVLNVKAFNLLADKSKVPLFRTATMVLLAGALVTIVLGVVFAAFAASASLSFDTLLIIGVPGGLVQDIAWVLLAIAFFRIKVPSTQTVTATSAPTLSGQVKYCPNCGMQNATVATYCTQCGQKL